MHVQGQYQRMFSSGANQAFIQDFLLRGGGGARTIVVLQHFSEHVCESMLLWHTKKHIYYIIIIFVQCMQSIVQLYMYVVTSIRK